MWQFIRRRCQLATAYFSCPAYRPNYPVINYAKCFISQSHVRGEKRENRTRSTWVSTRIGRLIHIRSYLLIPRIFSGKKKKSGNRAKRSRTTLARSGSILEYAIKLIRYNENVNGCIVCLGYFMKELYRQPLNPVLLTNEFQSFLKYLFEKRLPYLLLLYEFIPPIIRLRTMVLL